MALVVVIPEDYEHSWEEVHIGGGYGTFRTLGVLPPPPPPPYSLLTRPNPSPHIFAGFSPESNPHFLQPGNSLLRIDNNSNMATLGTTPSPGPNGELSYAQATALLNRSNDERDPAKYDELASRRLIVALYTPRPSCQHMGKVLELELTSETNLLNLLLQVQALVDDQAQAIGIPHKLLVSSINVRLLYNNSLHADYPKIDGSMVGEITHGDGIIQTVDHVVWYRGKDSDMASYWEAYRRFLLLDCEEASSRKVDRETMLKVMTVQRVHKPKGPDESGHMIVGGGHLMLSANETRSSSRNSSTRGSGAGGVAQPSQARPGGSSRASQRSKPSQSLVSSNPPEQSNYTSSAVPPQSSTYRVAPVMARPGTMNPPPRQAQSSQASNRPRGFSQAPAQPAESFPYPAGAENKAEKTRLDALEDRQAIHSKLSLRHPDLNVSTTEIEFAMSILSSKSPSEWADDEQGKEYDTTTTMAEATHTYQNVLMSSTSPMPQLAIKTLPPLLYPQDAEKNWGYYQRMGGNPEVHKLIPLENAPFNPTQQVGWVGPSNPDYPGGERDHRANGRAYAHLHPDMAVQEHINLGEPVPVAMAPYVEPDVDTLRSILESRDVIAGGARSPARFQSVTGTEAAIGFDESDDAEFCFNLDKTKGEICEYECMQRGLLPMQKHGENSCTSSLHPDSGVHMPQPGKSSSNLRNTKHGVDIQSIIASATVRQSKSRQSAYLEGLDAAAKGVEAIYEKMGAGMQGHGPAIPSVYVEHRDAMSEAAVPQPGYYDKVSEGMRHTGAEPQEQSSSKNIYGMLGQNSGYSGAYNTAAGDRQSSGVSRGFNSKEVNNDLPSLPYHPLPPRVSQTPQGQHIPYSQSMASQGIASFADLNKNAKAMYNNSYSTRVESPAGFYAIPHNVDSDATAAMAGLGDVRQGENLYGPPSAFSQVGQTVQSLGVGGQVGQQQMYNSFGGRAHNTAAENSGIASLPPKPYTHESQFQSASINYTESQMQNHIGGNIGRQGQGRHTAQQVEQHIHTQAAARRALPSANPQLRPCMHNGNMGLNPMHARVSASPSPYRQTVIPDSSMSLNNSPNYQAGGSSRHAYRGVPSVPLFGRRTPRFHGSNSSATTMTFPRPSGQGSSGQGQVTSIGQSSGDDGGAPPTLLRGDSPAFRSLSMFPSATNQRNKSGSINNGRPQFGAMTQESLGDGELGSGLGSGNAIPGPKKPAGI